MVCSLCDSSSLTSMLTWMTSGVLSACLSSSSKSDADFLIIWSSSWIDILPGVVGTGSFSLSNSNLKINYLHVHLEHHFGTFQVFKDKPGENGNQESLKTQPGQVLIESWWSCMKLDGKKGESGWSVKVDDMKTLKPSKELKLNLWKWTLLKNIFEY